MKPAYRAVATSIAFIQVQEYTRGMDDHKNARFLDADFSGARFHGVNFSNVKISDAWLFNVEISGLERHPERTSLGVTVRPLPRGLSPS